MYNKSTLFFLLFFSTFSFGQNFRLINPTRDYYFEPLDLNNQLTVAGVSIDSIVSSFGDSTFYSYKCMNKHGDYPFNGCFDIQDTGFTGEKILVRSNSESIFFNDEGDSILFKPQAALNTSWKMMELDSGKYIEAKVLSIDTMVLFGFIDSLKIIQLKAFNSSNTVISHLFNNYQFHISKQLGLIKTASLLRFPKDTMNYNLRGISNPDYGIKNITQRDIFNFNLNDTMQYFEKTPFNGSSSEQKWTQKNILSKYESANQDTLVYDIELIEYKKRWTSSGVLTTFYRHDTTVTHYIQSEDSIFNKRPNEYGGNYSTGGWMDESNLLANDTSYNFRNKKYFDGYSSYNSIDNCLGHFGGWCYVPYTLFATGLGHIAFDFDGGLFCQSEKMTYFHKGIETWGTSFNWSVILETNDLSQNIPLIVKPNPFEAEIKIEFLSSNSDDISVFISNSLGQMVFEKNFSPTSLIIIPTEKFANGLYFLSLVSANKVYQQKLVKY